MTAVHREQEIGLLGLGGQPGRRSAALHVDDDERELEADREAHRLGLEVDARPAGAGDAEVPRERGADRHAAAAISSSAWSVRTPKFLCRVELVEDVGRRGDRVRRVRDRQLEPARAMSPSVVARLPVMLR